MSVIQVFSRVKVSRNRYIVIGHTARNEASGKRLCLMLQGDKTDETVMWDCTMHSHAVEGDTLTVRGKHYLDAFRGIPQDEAIALNSELYTERKARET